VKSLPEEELFEQTVALLKNNFLECTVSGFIGRMLRSWFWAIFGKTFPAHANHD